MLYGISSIHRLESDTIARLSRARFRPQMRQAIQTCARRVIISFLTVVLTSVSFAAERHLVQVAAPDHDPVFIDTASVKRNGPVVSFNYVLNVLAAAEGRSVPGGWKSNEVVAAVDCSRSTFASFRLIAYTGPRATGSVSGTYQFTADEQKPAKIVPKATTAYLAAHVCANYPHPK